MTTANDTDNTSDKMSEIESAIKAYMLHQKVTVDQIQIVLNKLKPSAPEEKTKKKEKIYPNLDPLDHKRQIVEYKKVEFMCVKHLTKVKNPWFFTKLNTIPYHREISIIRKEKIDKFIKIIKQILKDGVIDKKSRKCLNNLIKD
jgi:hypothetical protein